MTAGCLYENAMGRAAFARLSEPLRRFHSQSGRVVFAGQVEVDAPASLVARLLALCLGAPQRAVRGAIRFELEAGSAMETWVRHFPARTLMSTLSADGAHVVERMGPARLAFLLCEVDGGLEMRLDHMRFLGIRCPRWLQPVLVAREHGKGGQLHFLVTAAVPLAGVVASYRGHLDVIGEAAP
jgi:hypothetical protein